MDIVIIQIEVAIASHHIITQAIQDHEGTHLVITNVMSIITLPIIIITSLRRERGIKGLEVRILGFLGIVGLMVGDVDGGREEVEVVGIN